MENDIQIPENPTPQPSMTIGGGCLIALIFMMCAGTFAMFGLSEFHYSLVGEWVCPPDTTPSFWEGAYRDDDGSTGTKIELICENAAGDDVATEGMQLQFVVYVFGGYFLLCFVPLAAYSLISSAMSKRNHGLKETG